MPRFDADLDSWKRCSMMLEKPANFRFVAPAEDQRGQEMIDGPAIPGSAIPGSAILRRPAIRESCIHCNHHNKKKATDNLRWLGWMFNGDGGVGFRLSARIIVEGICTSCFPG